MRLTEVGIKQYQSATILNESWQQLTEAQQLYVGRWETNVWPLVEQYSRLMEAELTPDQIQQIFTSAEKAAVDSGENLTALGKAGKVTAEVSSKMKAEIEKLADQAANSGPIKNMDAQFDKLKSQLATKLKGNPMGTKILQGVEKWKSYAEDNPAKSAFIIGAMTSILAFASGGVVSGAAIGFFLKLANNTIKGDKLSTAVGKSVKGAALGAIAGLLGDMVSGFEATPGDIEGTVDMSGSSEIEAGTPEAEQVIQAFETTEEYRDAMARRLLEDRVAQFGGDIDPAMVNKIAANITINGNFPDNFTASFDGTFVRGTVYLTPEEAAEFKRFVGDEPMGALSKKATQWLEDNAPPGVDIDGDGQTNISDKGDGGTDPETGANEPESGMKPGEGFTTDSGATYSKEDIQNLVKQAAEKGEVPDIDSLVNSKDIDAGSYADDVSSIEAELRELGIDPLKVPDEDALKAVGVEDTAADAASDAGTSAKDDPDFAPGQKPDDFDSLDPADKADALLDVPPGQWTADDYQLMKDEGMLTLQDTQTYYASNLGDIPAEARSSSVEMKKFLSAELGDEFENANAMQRSKVVKFLMQRAKVADSIEFDQDFLMQEELWDALDAYELREAPSFMAAMGKGIKNVTQAAGKAAAKGASKAGGAIAKGAKAAGKELGNKVTTAKLNRMWKKAGSPTDTGSIVNVLTQAGLSDELIGTVSKETGVDLPKTSASDTGAVDIKGLAAEIKKAGIADQVKQMLNA
jgi:hypothetical protein